MLGRQIYLLTFENSKSSGPISTPVLLLSNQETTPPEEIIFLNEKKQTTQVQPHILDKSSWHHYYTSWKSQKLHATYKPVLSFYSVLQDDGKPP